MPSKWTQTEAAEHLHISTRQVRNLVTEGVLVPRADGSFDPLSAALAYLGHTQKDAAGKAARTALAQVETRRKELQVRRHLGQLVTLDELGRLSEDLWAGVWNAWNLATANFHAQVSHLRGISEADVRRIAGSCDQLGKGELVALRERWAAKLRGERVALHDDRRIEALLAQLADGADDAGDADAEE